MRHSKVEPVSLEWNVKAGAGSFVGLPGFESNVVSGSVRSTVTEAIDVDWWPTSSVATALIARAPSAGTGHEPLYGAVVSVPSEVTVPPVQSPVEQAKNSTLATPVPASVAVAV